MIYLTHGYEAPGVSFSVLFVESLAIAMTLYRMRVNHINLFDASGRQP